MTGKALQSIRRAAEWLHVVGAGAWKRIAKIHWYPTHEELAALPVETVVSLRQENGGAVMGSTFSLLGTAIFCLVALQSPDSLLLQETPAIKLPLVDTEISFFAFLLAGPLVLLGLWAYLAIHLRYHLELGRALRTRSANPVPTFAELRHPFRRFIVGLAHWIVTPAVMLVFLWKSMAVQLGVLMAWAALLAVWFHVVSAAGLASRRAARWTLIAVGSVLLLALAVGAWRSPRMLTRPTDLAGANLADAVLPGERLVRANAVGANFKNAKLARANLQYADLRRANLQGADLSGADLTGARFFLTDLREADLSNAKLHGVQLAQSDASKARFTAAELVRAQLDNTRFDEADLSFAKLDGSAITSSSFVGARLNGVALDNLASYQPPLISRNTGLEAAKDFTEQQAGQLHQLREYTRPNQPTATHGRPGAFDPILPEQYLREPVSNRDPMIVKGIVARAAKDSPVKLPSQITDIVAAGNKDWKTHTFNDSPPGADVSETGAAVRPVQPKAPEASVWGAFIAHINQHPAVRQWLIDIVKAPKETVGLRKEALTALLHLTKTDAAREAFHGVLKWYLFEGPQGVADADFRERDVRRYLVIHAIANASLPDDVALGILMHAYGADWESFLKRYAPYFPLEPVEQKAIQFAQERAKQLLAVAQTRYGSDAERAALRAQFTTWANSR